MKSSEAYSIIKNTDIWNWKDFKSALEFINGNGCVWSDAEKIKARLMAADRIDMMIKKDFGVLLNLYSTRFNREAFPIIRADSEFELLRELALPTDEWADERMDRGWDEPLNTKDAVFGDRSSGMIGCSVDQRLEVLKDIADHYYYTEGCRNLIYITDRTFLDYLLQTSCDLNEEICLQTIIVSSITEDVGLVFSPCSPESRILSIITGNYHGSRLMSTNETKLAKKEVKGWLFNSIFSIVSSMSEGDISDAIEVCHSSTEIIERYYYLDWGTAEKAARQFSGDPEMKKAVKTYTLPTNSYFVQPTIKSPAIIVDKRRLKALGFVFQKDGKKESFLLNDDLMAFQITEQGKKDDGRSDDFSRYKSIVDMINTSLASVCTKVSNKKFPLPGMKYDFNADEIKYIINKLILGQKKSYNSVGEDIPPSLEPVEGVNLKPYLSAMVNEGYLVEIGKNRYKRTKTISDEAVVLFAYLLNDELAKGYDRQTDYEKKLLKRWYEEGSWCGEKPDKPGKTFDRLEEWRRTPDRKLFLSVKKEDIEEIENDFKIKVEIHNTRTIRTKYFSRLLSIPEKRMTKNKSAAIEDERKEKLTKSINNEIFDLIRVTGKRAKVLDVFYNVNEKLKKQ